MDKKHVFSTTEKKIFVDIVKKYEVVENKRTDSATLNAKRKAWDRIMHEFNSNPLSDVKATAKQLRRLWMNLKQRRRDEMIKRQQRQYMARLTSNDVVEPDLSQVKSEILVEIGESCDSDNISEMIIERDPLLAVEVKDLKATPSHLPIDPNIPSSPLLSKFSLPSPPNNGSLAKLQNKANKTLEMDERREKRAQEIHQFEIKLLKEKIREARAKADLAELLYRRQSPSGS